MMRLLLLNDHYFNTLPPPSGVHVFRVGSGEGQDIQFNPDTDNLVEVLEKAEFQPDVALQVDSIDGRFFAPGLEQLNIPLAFYAIDAPINSFWQRWYSYGFDRVFVDQHEEWRAWRDDGMSWARWLPLAADLNIYHHPENGAERDLDIVFVGTLDSALRPKRSAILHRLRMIANVHMVDGGGTRSETVQNVANLYRRARIVLNENLFDGINLRTFEAMACGAVVLTENGRGQDRLFKNNKHLVGYTSQNLEEVVIGLLNTPDKISSISAEAVKIIHEKHTLSHRFQQVLSDLSTLKIRSERLQKSCLWRQDWGLWQAMWKWPENWPNLRRGIAERLMTQIKRLSGLERASFHEGVGDHEAAVRALLDTLEMHPGNRTAIAGLAALAMSAKDHVTVRKILSADEDSDPADLHVKIGRLLEEEGRLFTPGFNRQASPITGWSAFEHYHRAWRLNEDHLPALEGLDRILASQKASEFTWGMWQRYHARHPKAHEVEKILQSRAVDGFLMSGRPGMVTATVREDPQVSRWSIPSKQGERVPG